MIGTVVKHRATRQAFQVVGWSESDGGRWTLSPLSFGTTIAASPMALLRDYSGVKPEDVASPPSEADILRAADAATAPNRDYGAAHKQARPPKAPPIGSPEDVFKNGKREPANDSTAAKRQAVEIARDPERFAAWSIGALQPHPQVDAYLRVIAEEIDRG